jgi:uncharacterized protein YraI
MAGIYTFTVRALSGDVAATANGDLSAFSAEVELDSEGNVVGGEEPGEPTKLTTPASVTWTDDWKATFATVDNAKEYTVTLYKGALGEGVKVGSSLTVADADAATLTSGAFTVTESGDYYVGVVAVPADTETYANSNEAFSGIKEYTETPGTTTLGTPGGLTWDGTTAKWTASTGIAAGDEYVVTLYRDNVKVGEFVTVAYTATSYAEFDLTDPGSYTFTVQATTERENFADSAVSAKSGAKVVEEPEVPDQLPMTASITIGDDWSVSFAAVTGADGFTVTLYKGALGSGVEEESHVVTGNSVVANTFNLTELGDYYVGVVAVHPDDPDLNSEEKFSAVKAFAQISKPSGLRWEEEVAAWNASTGIVAASEYEVILYQEAGATDTKLETKTVAGSVKSVAFDAALAEGESYYFTVQAFHGQYAVADSAVSDPSPVLLIADYSEIEDAIDEIESTLTNPNAVRDALETLDQQQLASAMQNNESIREDMAKIEAEYAANRGSTVDHTVAPALGIAKEDIDIIGAGFSVAPGATIELKFTESTADVDMDGYEHPFQLDIDLVQGGMSVTPITPVTITMPIPAGVEAQRIVILHVLRSGAIEKITPTVKDGKITFTVTSFSPFVIVNEKRQSSGGGGDDSWGGNGNWPSNYYPVPTIPAPVAPAPTVPSAANPFSFRVIARSLNVRSGPGTAYVRVGSVKANDVISVIGYSPDGLWAQTTAGWVSMAHVAQVVAIHEGDYIVSVKSTLNVRSGAGTSFGKIGSLANNALVYVTSVTGGWAQIQYNGGVGYVSTVYLR